MIIRAAGGVLWRVREEGVTVAVIHRPRHDDWTLPKGKLNDGEDELEAAVREVAEETGAVVEVGPDLGWVEYVVTRAGRTQPKTVRYWALRWRGGEFVATDEVDALDWLGLAEAAARLSHGRDRQVLARFAALPAR